MFEYGKIQIIKKDICFLYHELTIERLNNKNAMPLDGDMAFETLYTNDYWGMIKTIFDIEQEDTNNHVDDEYFDLTFLGEGCLIIIFLMAMENINGYGSYIADRFEQSKNAIILAKKTSISPILVDDVSFTLKLIGNEVSAGDESRLKEITFNIYNNYVKKYFQTMNTVV